MTSKPPRSSAAAKPSRSSTRKISHSMPSSARVSPISSASLGLSSTWRIRTSLRAATSDPIMTSREPAGRRLVDDRPEDADAADGLDELLEDDRLDDVGVGAEAVGLDDVL